MSESRPTLHLVDGSGYIFRAFFALPQLNNSRGLPTNAVYGFTRMLVKLLKDARPSHLAIVFDSPKRTFRDDLFADYKANRTTPPSDLIVQIPYIHRLVEAFQIKKLMIEGYEADDVIGTLAIRAAKQKFGVTIVTADKDFMQLVSSTITLWDTMRDRRIGMREVREKFGTETRGVIEIMALMGDSIDNIKGVPGVGEKTATSLIKRFGSVEALYSNLAALETATEIRGAKKLAGIIGQHRADVELARKLVRIETDAPIEVELDAMSYHGIDEKAAAELIRELEFTSLLKELTPSEVKLGQTTGAEVTVTESEIPAAIEELRQAAGLVAHLQEIDSAQVLKLQATGAEKIYVVPSNLIGAMKPVLEAEQPPKTFHDVKTHLRTLGALGISVRG